MKRPQSLKDIAIDVDDLVRRSNSIAMEIFRNRCKIGYSKAQERFDEYPKEIIANKEKPGQKLSDKLRKKLEEKFANKPSIFEYLYIPQSYYDPKLEYIENVFGKPAGNAPYDQELSLLADYIKLTILHDRYLEPPGANPINNGIWSEAESWAEKCWKGMEKGLDSPKVVNIFHLSYKRVKEDLNRQHPEKTNERIYKNSTSDQKKIEDKTNLSWQAKTIAFAIEHRDWTVEKIAKKVGVARQTLYKDKKIADALKARNKQKRSDKRHYPRGQKGEDRSIEAWSDT